LFTECFIGDRVPNNFGQLYYIRKLSLLTLSISRLCEGSCTLFASKIKFSYKESKELVKFFLSMPISLIFTSVVLILERPKALLM
ncbi:MAG TPA: hypothetical protein PKX92_13530, partial [Edaphocola sp.]|nr:hypothetical protein [Edaphocola sp.]